MFEGSVFRRVYWGYNPIFQGVDAVTSWGWNLVSLIGVFFSYLNFFVNSLILPFSSVTSIMGFMLLSAIAVQLLSGFYLGWYYIPEPGLVVELSEEMFSDTRFGSEIFYLHVSGVDTIFVLSYLHILKKIFLKNYMTAESDGWILGGYAFFWFNYIVALGISLSASHLSDLTLTIIANIYWSLFNNIHKSYYVMFTNKHLNIDQMTRMMVLHYFTPWYYLYLVQLHVMFCHESWDSDSGEVTYEDKSGSFIAWFYDAFLKEMQDGWYWATIALTFFLCHYWTPPQIYYHFFESWNIAELDEMSFYGVAPHWYFKPLMGLLVMSPTHYEGLLWMALFFLLLSFLPVIYNWYNVYNSYMPAIPMQNSFLQTVSFMIFLMSLYCTTSILPCGRYYYEVEGGYAGDQWLKFSYQYIYIYMGWFLHHIDVIEHYGFQFFRTFASSCSKMFSKKQKQLSSVVSKFSKICLTKKIKNLMNPYYDITDTRFKRFKYVKVVRFKSFGNDNCKLVFSNKPLLTGNISAKVVSLGMTRSSMFTKPDMTGWDALII